MTAFRQQVQAFIDANLLPAARSARLAEVARQARDDLIQSGQASPHYTTFVDGRRGAAEESVRGDGGGRIYYEFIYLADAVAFAIGYLRGRSPVQSGAFRDSFFVSLDGAAGVRWDQFRQEDAQAARQAIIYNPEPYTRKVDVQMIGGRVLHFSVPAGLFDDAARAVRGRFGNAVSARRMSNVDFPGKYRLKVPQYRRDRPGRPHRGAGESVQSPALLISALG